MHVAAVRVGLMGLDVSTEWCSVMEVRLQSRYCKL